MASAIDKQHLKDIQFMTVAKIISNFSKCSSRQIGSVLVRDNCIISTGYNGTAKGISECQDRSKPCKRRLMGYGSGEGIEHCGAVHSEINVFLQAGYNGICTKDSTLYVYCDAGVCRNCAASLINAGVKRLVYLAGGSMYDYLAEGYLKEAKIEVCTIEPFDVE